MKDLIKNILQFIIDMPSFLKMICVFVFALHFVVPLAKHFADPIIEKQQSVHEQRAQILNNLNK